LLIEHRHGNSKIFGAMAVLPGAYEPKKTPNASKCQLNARNFPIQEWRKKPLEMTAITSPFPNVPKVQACPSRSKPGFEVCNSVTFLPDSPDV